MNWCQSIGWAIDGLSHELCCSSRPETVMSKRNNIKKHHCQKKQKEMF